MARQTLLLPFAKSETPGKECNELVLFAKRKKCDGIICGHIHQSANEYYEGIHYLNSGDWVESLTALVEDEQGNWSVVTYTEEAFGENLSGETLMEAAI